MFILLALLAFINAQNDAYIKEEENASSGESLISNDEGISSNSDIVVDGNTNSTDGSNSSINDGGASSNNDESSVLNDGGASSNNDESSVLNDGGASSNNDESSVLNDGGASSNNDESSVLNDEGASSNNDESSVLNDEGASSNNDESSFPVDDSTISNEYHPGDSESSSKNHSSISPSLKLFFENLNDVLNDGISKATISKYYKDEDEKKDLDEFFDTYISNINMITNKSLVLYPNRKGSYSKYISPDASLSSFDERIDAFLKEGKEIFKTAKPILTELGPDLAKIVNIDLSVLESLYNYILIDQNDGVTFGNLLDKLGISKGWISKVQNVVSVFDDAQPISKLFDGLGVTKEYDDVIKKILVLNITNDDNRKFLSINSAADVVTSAMTLIRKAYNEFVKKYYDDPILPLIKKYGFKPANIFESSINTRSTSLVSLMDKIKSYNNQQCEKEDTLETLQDIKCLIYNNINGFLASAFCKYYSEGEDKIDEKCAKDIWEKAKGYFTEYTKPEINLTNLLVDKYGLHGNTVKLISGIVADVLDPSKNFVNVLVNAAEYLEDEDIIKDLSYQSFARALKYVTDFFADLGDSSNFYQIFSNLGFTDQWKMAVKIVQEVSIEKPLCNLSFLYDHEDNDYYYNQCLDEWYEYLQKIKYFISEDVTIKSLIGGEEEEREKEGEELEEGQGFIEIINTAIPILQDITKNIPSFLSSAYEKVGRQMLTELLNLTLPEKIDFTNVFSKTFGISDELVSLVDFLFPCVARELPVFSKYYPRVIQKTHQILGAFKNAQTIPNIANAFYDGIGVVFDMLASASKAYKGLDTKIIDIINAVTPTSFLNLAKTAAELNKIGNFTLHNIARAIIYDGSGNILTINDVAPYKTLVLNSGELYTNMNSRKLNLDLMSKSLGVPKEELKEKFRSLITPLTAAPRQFILNIVKNYTRSDDKNVGSYFDKLRLIASSIEAGSLIKTNTDGIEVTPVPTPPPSESNKPEEPPLEDNYQESEQVGETIVLKEVNVTTMNKAFKEAFTNTPANSDGYRHVEFEINKEEITWDDKLFDFKDAGDKDYAKIVGPKKINLPKDKKVNLILNQDETTFSIPDANNVKLSLKVENPSLFGKQTKTVVLETGEGVSSVSLKTTSDLSAPVEIKVNKGVTAVEIDSINLHNAGKISVKDGEDNPVNIKISTIVADTGAESSLSNVHIEQEFKINQTAFLKLSDVSFSNNANINFNLQTYSQTKFDRPLIKGTLKSPPGKIAVTKPSTGDITPDHNYPLIEGEFEPKCSAWKEVLIIENTGFESKECVDTATGAFLSEAASLVLRTNAKDPDGGKGGNKLSAGAIAGIVIGCVVAVAIVVVVVIIVLRKKKQDASSNENGGKEDAEL
ncbi:hypothetical protein M9Y10_004088 [Tritrichomonas musculus]|uniref:Uncharacterized protein n=1 Tax=Tritrichomonas musculus TaxID=1915356 RepID=A0ABR2JRJ0_9EUKA